MPITRPDEWLSQNGAHINHDYGSHVEMWYTRESAAMHETQR